MEMREFEELLGKDIPAIHWDAIERIYMWHPALERPDAKQVVVELYRLLGFVPFLAMYDDASKAMDLKGSIGDARRYLSEAEAKLEAFNALFV